MISILKMVDLSGKDGVVSEFSPGVFLQVYLFAFFLSYFGILLIFSKVTPYLEVEYVRELVASLGRDLLSLWFRELLLLMFFNLGICMPKLLLTCIF